MGKHLVGSNYFWYLREPAGNFSEYGSDVDCFVDDQLRTPGVWEGDVGLDAVCTLGTLGAFDGAAATVLVRRDHCPHRALLILLGSLGVSRRMLGRRARSSSDR